MEDIEVIIKIPENIYNHIKNTWRKRRGSCPESYIAWGTPLEKHDEEVIKKTVESIWGKPPYTELLDNIRAEIEELYGKHVVSHCVMYGPNPKYIPLSEVLQIIDKYKKSEDKTK